MNAVRQSVPPCLCILTPVFHTIRLNIPFCTPNCLSVSSSTRPSRPLYYSLPTSLSIHHSHLWPVSQQRKIRKYLVRMLGTIILQINFSYFLILISHIIMTFNEMLIYNRRFQKSYTFNLTSPSYRN